MEPSLPTILLGDFNQCVPRKRQPQKVFSALNAALSPRFRLVTAGAIAGAPSLSIDHLAVSGELEAMQTDFLNNYDENGDRMSDHIGLNILLKSMTTTTICQEITARL